MDSLRSLGTTLIALIRTRIELIVTELQEEKERRKEMLILAAIAMLFFLLGLLLAAFFVIAFFWDTHRLWAAGGMAALYLGIAGWATIRLQGKARNAPPPFEATLSEFQNDLEALRRQDE